MSELDISNRKAFIIIINIETFVTQQSFHISLHSFILKQQIASPLYYQELKISLANEIEFFQICSFLNNIYYIAAYSDHYHNMHCRNIFYTKQRTRYSFLIRRLHILAAN
ncbi:hypothetical protein TTHERM_000248349 (macronuclear) [Tetrahymena thermophila SB210]|uniref:Uncharacterized protein n=1 Tax=Tetrahymena thermophila (strain SB210) TaxID=312017 RepID=W7XGM6_TETTS|nr:hypothetical protein TTHERM_000248349 [Tetrahymena thermophila SB210]EWS72094.1 hypothetical protein TTHERM_000248349 [Tetrahymena thermophila SB210]|eukprot:XP_012655405.1 hypothetical protein TTHERM_000248349 [Tetrahymena thermophila SB210]